ncbi:MAG: hypothetical protein IK079_05315 [Desulfovibrio sp.]|nr:hypothetical protein [Desulfovibrio sp.]
MTPSLTISSDSNTDFAAELRLNRIMNGQETTSSGKIVNAASRNMATRHDSLALNYNVLADNVACAQTVVTTTQNALTELVSEVKTLREFCISADDDAQAQQFAASIKEKIDAILDTECTIVKDDNELPIKVLGNQGKTISMGETLLGGAHTDSMVVGNADVLGGTKFNALYSGLSSITVSNAKTLCDDALDELFGKISNQGVQFNVLSNRYHMLNDLASTYHMGSDDQGVSTRYSTNVINALF